eukprot:scaffold151034_cov27-Prasinocladus_malaysianus.AAC.1
MDKVEVVDISSKCGMHTLIGPESDSLLRELNAVSIYPPSPSPRQNMQREVLNATAIASGPGGAVTVATWRAMS